MIPGKKRDLETWDCKGMLAKQGHWYHTKSHPGNFGSGLKYRLEGHILVLIRGKGAGVVIQQTLVKGFPRRDGNSQEVPASHKHSKGF